MSASDTPNQARRGRYTIRPFRISQYGSLWVFLISTNTSASEPVSYESYDTWKCPGCPPREVSWSRGKCLLHTCNGKKRTKADFVFLSRSNGIPSIDSRANFFVCLFWLFSGKDESLDSSQPRIEPTTSTMVWMRSSFCFAKAWFRPASESVRSCVLFP
jgi:hypothetical protein